MRSFLSGCYRALRPPGRGVASTSYHGYIKNLAIREAGFAEVEFCGRVRLPVPLEVDGGRRDAGRLTGVCR
jgi:hypothetical protein